MSIHHLVIVSHGWRSLLHRLINVGQLLFPESHIQRFIHLIFGYLAFACVKLDKFPRKYWINTLWSGPLTSPERSALELLENSILPIYNSFFFHLKLKMDRLFPKCSIVKLNDFSLCWKLKFSGLKFLHLQCKVENFYMKRHFMWNKLFKWTPNFPVKAQLCWKIFNHFLKSRILKRNEI